MSPLRYQITNMSATRADRALEKLLMRSPNNTEDTYLSMALFTCGHTTSNSSPGRPGRVFMQNSPCQRPMCRLYAPSAGADCNGRVNKGKQETK